MKTLKTEDLRGRFTNVEEFNDLLGEYWKRGETLNQVKVTPIQNQILINAQPKQIMDWETGEVMDNPIIYGCRPEKMVSIYESDYMNIQIIVEEYANKQPHE